MFSRWRWAPGRCAASFAWRRRVIVPTRRSRFGSIAASRPRPPVRKSRRAPSRGALRRNPSPRAAHRALPPGPTLRLVRRRCDTGPLVHLHAGDEPVAAVLRPEQGGFALLHVEPILAQRRNDVRLVRYEDGVRAGRRLDGEHLAQSFGAAAVLVR